MTSEATLVQDLEYAHLELTVADGEGIEYGTLLKLSDPSTAAASSADGDFFAGILLKEKVASDGQTRVAVSRHGVWDVYTGAATITAGDMVKIAGANIVATADDDQVEHHSEVVGLALQSGAVNEKIEILVGAH